MNKTFDCCEKCRSLAYDGTPEQPIPIPYCSNAACECHKELVEALNKHL